MAASASPFFNRRYRAEERAPEGWSPSHRLDKGHRPCPRACLEAGTQCRMESVSGARCAIPLRDRCRGFQRSESADIMRFGLSDDRRGAVDVLKLPSEWLRRMKRSENSQTGAAFPSQDKKRRERLSLKYRRPRGLRNPINGPARENECSAAGGCRLAAEGRRARPYPLRKLPDLLLPKNRSQAKRQARRPR